MILSLKQTNEQKTSRSIIPGKKQNKSIVPGSKFPHLAPCTLKKLKTKTVIALWRKKELIIKGDKN